jgi:hypothetical protein
VEQAKNKNKKNLLRASKFNLAGVQVDATRRIPLVVGGRGCAVLRTKVAAGWVPGPPFATHGDVGVNALCTPTAMREWLAAAPGGRLAQPLGRRAWEGGASTSNRDEATAAFALRSPVVSLGSGAVAPLTEAQRIAELTPSSDSILLVPAWLTQFASAASAGEDFWA